MGHYMPKVKWISNNLKFLEGDILSITHRETDKNVIDYFKNGGHFFKPIINQKTMFVNVQNYKIEVIINWES
jgi:hypothetical protein